MKTLTAAMTAHINGELTTLATCWHVTRTDGVELFITDHDTDIAYGGDTYVASTGIARTSIESASDMSVDNLDVVGILSGQMEKNELLAGHYDFAEFDIFSVNWVDPDGFGKIQHRFGTIGEIQVKDGSYTGELRGMMQLLERRRGKVWTPDCRANLFSPLVDPYSGRATGCGVVAGPYEEYGEVVSVTNDRQFVVNEFSQKTETPEYAGAEGDVVGVHETDGVVEMVLDIADGSPMRPYVCTTKAHLEAMADDLNGYYVLAANIDCGWSWTPIGTDAAPFRGVFDGRGHYVYKCLTYTAAAPGEPAGFFGTLAGTCRRFGIEGANMRGGDALTWTGGIAGRLVGEDAADHPGAGAGIIEDCYVVGDGITTDGDRAGGLVGEQTAGTIIRSCWVAVNLSGSIGIDVGALIGKSSGDNRIIDGATANTDLAGTTDLGNITGGNANGLTNAEWPVVANWDPTKFDLVDQLKMPTTSEAITLSFEHGPSLDTITRSSGNWLTDSKVRPGDAVTLSGTVQSGGMTPSTSIVIDDVGDTFTRTVGDWEAEGFVAGQTITVALSASNNGDFEIDTVTPLVLTVVEDITVAEGAQTDLVISWSADNDITVYPKSRSTVSLYLTSQVESAPPKSVTMVVAKPPVPRDRGRF